MADKTNIAEQVYSGLGAVVRFLVFISLVAGIVLLARIVLLFFGSLKTVPGFEQVMMITDLFLGSLKDIDPVRTPYKGIFDLGATGALLVVLLFEYCLQSIKNVLDKQAVRSRQTSPVDASSSMHDAP
jgi:hypothetical protein